MNKDVKNKKIITKKLEYVINLKTSVDKMPDLPKSEVKRFEEKMANEHLYYSSKLEGSSLNKKQMKLAVNNGNTKT